MGRIVREAACQNSCVSFRLRDSWPWLAGWLLLAGAGIGVLAWQDRSRERDAFENQARIAHRLLSQRAAQHDAVLATLALLQPPPGDESVQRLPALYPQVLAVRQLARDARWPEAAFQQAQAASQREGRPVLASADLGTGRAWLLLAAAPTTFALQLDLQRMVPAAEWPMARETSPVRIALSGGGARLDLQRGQPERGAPWHFDLRKPLASASHPFEVIAERDVRWSELPWLAWAAWTAVAAAITAAVAALYRQRAARLRAEELLRLGQVSRLNTLGELAAGLAHELNQPLTAVLATTQAAKRLLDEEPPDVAPARDAMQQAAAQARRASDVVARLRRTIERPSAHPAQPVVLQDAVRNAFHLLEPEFTRRAVHAQLQGGEPVRVRAEPVALEQIIHNLLMNALQALDQVPAGQRELLVEVGRQAEGGVLSVADTGPGIAPELLPRIFDPFVTTRDAGLGLGLSLCESLATGMGGSLQALQRASRGALFRLTLPAA